MNRWRKSYTVSAHLLVGGVLWEMKVHGGVIYEGDLKVNLIWQKTFPIANKVWHTTYYPP
jgi:hypothetical protein